MTKKTKKRTSKKATKKAAVSKQELNSGPFERITKLDDLEEGRFYFVRYISGYCIGQYRHGAITSFGVNTFHVGSKEELSLEVWCIPTTPFAQG